VPSQYQVSGGSASEIAASIEHGVASGALAPGDRLPSVRALAAALDVSPTTVAAALADLRRRGLVVSRPRSGTRIGARPPLRSARQAPAAPPGMRDLASGNPDPALLPDLAGALHDLPAPHRLYGDPPVLPELAEVAHAALREDGVLADAARLCVVNGALDGIERVLVAHLEPGDAVAVEDPGWPGVIDLVRALGLRVIGVPVDGRGMVPEALERALRAGARAVVLTPRAQNPTGAAHDAERAAELRGVLGGDVLLVEDDHLGPVAGVPWHSAAGASDRWAVVRSVSKWLGPDLRCALLAGDELTLARVEGRQSLGPGWVSGLIQRLTARLWTDPAVLALVDRAREAYAARREATLAALAAHGLQASGASGLNVWVPVADEDAAVRTLLAAGASVAAGAPFRLAAAPAIRITTATVTPEEAARLASALAGAVRPPRRTRAA
jgi:DNA-binding transcriptional MocR family regulator